MHYFRRPTRVTLHFPANYEEFEGIAGRILRLRYAAENYVDAELVKKEAQDAVDCVVSQYLAGSTDLQSTADSIGTIGSCVAVKRCFERVVPEPLILRAVFTARLPEPESAEVDETIEQLGRLSSWLGYKCRRWSDDSARDLWGYANCAIALFEKDHFPALSIAQSVVKAMDHKSGPVCGIAALLLAKLLDLRGDRSAAAIRRYGEMHVRNSGEVWLSNRRIWGI